MKKQEQNKQPKQQTKHLTEGMIKPGARFYFYYKNEKCELCCGDRGAIIQTDMGKWAVITDKTRYGMHWRVRMFGKRVTGYVAFRDTELVTDYEDVKERML